MKSALTYLLLIFLLLSACDLSLPVDRNWEISEFIPNSMLTYTNSATATINPRYTPNRFPSCQPAPGGKPYQRSAWTNEPHFEPAAGSLRNLAANKGIYIGTSVAPQLLKNPDYSRLLAAEFNMVTPETAMKWEIIHPDPEIYDFSLGDLLIDFALEHKMQVRGHVLVWDLQMPDWVTAAEHTHDEWIQILCKHIKTVVSHYRGQIYAWDIVNEAVNQDGTIRNTFWMHRIGPEYIAMAFQWAREADPSAKLFYNDNGGEGLNPKSQAIYTLAQEMIETGIPIDGVGMQMHTAIYASPNPADLQQNIQRLAELGLEIHITEMDVRLQIASDSNLVKLAAQAEVYRQAASACLDSENCKAIITWGLSDRYSWIPDWTGVPDAPLLFDESGAPKPAYFAVQEVLAR
jgi:endo-1,4-beta-xylanase